MNGWGEISCQKLVAFMILDPDKHLYRYIDFRLPKHSRRSQEQQRTARSSQDIYIARIARSSQKQPGAARSSEEQEQP
jgi:hypothetical protein